MKRIAIISSESKSSLSIGAALALHYEVEYIEASASTASFDLTIFQLANVSAISNNQTLLESLSKSGKVLLIASWDSFEGYLSALRTGISAVLSLPCSSRNLLSVISIIIESKFSEIILTPESASFSYNGSRFDIPVPFELILTQMLIASKNNSYQSTVLSQLLKSKQANEIFFADQDTFDANDYQMEQDIIKGIKNNEFMMYYQAVCRIDSLLPAGFEALIRWNKDGQVVLPDEFIPVAERTNAIFPLTRWAFDFTMRNIRTMIDLFGQSVKLRITINLSARLFEDDTIAEYIIDKMHDYSLSPENIGIEITESAISQSMESANLILLKLKSAGFTLYMDDFGTGYSSLTYLKHFPVDIIKIDKSFVKWLNVDDDSEHIVRSILGLAHGLNLSVVGEGVEEQEHLDFLRENGCEYGQGYFFSKPLPFTGAIQYLEKYYQKCGDCTTHGS